MTILSRCQRFDFNLISAQRILKRLKTITKKEKFKIDDAALALVARKALGSLLKGLAKRGLLVLKGTTKGAGGQRHTFELDCSIAVRPQA